MHEMSAALQGTILLCTTGWRRLLFSDHHCADDTLLSAFNLLGQSY